MSTPAGWYPQPDGQQRYWDGHKYTATWSPGVGPVANPVSGGEPGSASGEAAWEPGMPSAPLGGKGFFATLFDFGFTSFITLKMLSFAYGLLVVLILLAGVVALVLGISRGGTDLLIAICGVPIATLIYLVMIRVSMEMVALFFRIGQNTNLMAASASSASPTRKAVEATRV